MLCSTHTHTPRLMKDTGSLWCNGDLNPRALPLNLGFYTSESLTLTVESVHFTSIGWFKHAMCHTDFRFGPKVGQISSKWGKSWIFFRSDSVHFGSVSQNVLNLIWKKNPRIGAIWGQSDPLWSQTYHLWFNHQYCLLARRQQADKSCLSWTSDVGQKWITLSPK